ncbi:unnamed protein product [Dovyalis caffra]|uniref:Uncharacterized protein n=1 Tax=Dovyalis caffra TaxID=77055 RepID=A0AAV1RQT7_9ROSI|nr:unnamed protein product [Dovyalis caffra]
MVLNFQRANVSMTHQCPKRDGQEPLKDTYGLSTCDDHINAKKSVPTAIEDSDRPVGAYLGQNLASLMHQTTKAKEPLKARSEDKEVTAAGSNFVWCNLVIAYAQVE